MKLIMALSIFTIKSQQIPKSNMAKSISRAVREALIYLHCQLTDVGMSTRFDREFFFRCTHQNVRNQFLTFILGITL